MSSPQLPAADDLDSYGNGSDGRMTTQTTPPPKDDFKSYQKDGIACAVENFERPVLDLSTIPMYFQYPAGAGKTAMQLAIANCVIDRVSVWEEKAVAVVMLSSSRDLAEKVEEERAAWPTNKFYRVRITTDPTSLDPGERGPNVLSMTYAALHSLLDGESEALLQKRAQCRSFSAIRAVLCDEAHILDENEKYADAVAKLVSLGGGSGETPVLQTRFSSSFKRGTPLDRCLTPEEAEEAGLFSVRRR